MILIENSPKRYDKREKIDKKCFRLAIFLHFLFGLLLVGCKGEAHKPHVGEQIRAARLKQNISQIELAEAVGMNLVSLSLVEDGFATPIEAKLEAIEKRLGVELEY